MRATSTLPFLGTLNSRGDEPMIRTLSIIALVIGALSAVHVAAGPITLDFNVKPDRSGQRDTYLEKGFRITVLAGHYDLCSTPNCSGPPDPCPNNYDPNGSSAHTPDCSTWFGFD